jgi:Arc/MetJ-type ribon-helix-helix transcriptional regulator
MKRITVSLPDELVERIKKAAGGEGHVSAYVAAALAEHEEGESLDELLAAWEAETPVPDEVHQKVVAELEAAGFDLQPRKRTAG